MSQTVTSTAGLPGLRAAREAKLLTQIDLAERSGVNRSTISDLEVGSRNAQYRTIHQLAAALDVSPQDLVTAPARLGRRTPKTGANANASDAHGRTA